MTAPPDTPLSGVRMAVEAYCDGTVTIEWTFSCGHTAAVNDRASKIRAMCEMLLRHCDAADAVAEGHAAMRLPAAGSA